QRAERSLRRGTSAAASGGRDPRFAQTAALRSSSARRRWRDRGRSAGGGAVPRDGSSCRIGLAVGAAARPAAVFVGAPDDDRAGGDDAENVPGQGGGSEHVLQGRQVDQGGGEAEFEGDAGEQEGVGGQADLAERGVVGAGGHRGADLAGDQPGEGGGGRGQVGVVQRGAAAGGVARVPSGAPQNV